MQVKRQRVSKVQSGLFGRPTGSRIRLVAAGTAALAIASGGVSYASTEAFGHDQVGQTTHKGLVVSSDQYVKPIGKRLVINPGKIMSSTVSPDGTHVAASVTDGGMALVIVDLKNWKV
ncbi:MAG TPA: phosphoesterase, partial [Actinoallomurus sp.]